MKKLFAILFAIAFLLARYSTILVCLPSEALFNAVPKVLLLKSILAPLSTKYVTTSKCPALEATINTLPLRAYSKLISAPFFRSNII